MAPTNNSKTTVGVTWGREQCHCILHIVSSARVRVAEIKVCREYNNEVVTFAGTN